MSKLKTDNTASKSKPRSQRELLSQLKSLVGAAGGDKKFLAEYEGLNVDKVGRTTVYDALHGGKVGVKLSALLDRIKLQQDKQTLKAADKFESTDAAEDQKLNNTGDGPKGDGKVKTPRKPRASKYAYDLTRSVSAYVKQLKGLISASGSERKFFTHYARFNTLGAARSGVYEAVHEGHIRPALAQMLDGIKDGKPVKVEPKGNTITRTQRAKSRRSVQSEQIDLSAGSEDLPVDSVGA